MTDAVCTAACLWFVTAFAFSCSADGPGVMRGETRRRLASYCTLLLHFPWPAAKSPSSGLRGKQNRSCFLLLVFSLLWSFHGISKIGEWGRGMSENVCWKTPPSLCHVVDFSQCLRVWSRVFQLTVLPSTYTLRSRIPFVKIISWSRHTCLCWFSSNPSITR